MISLSAFQMLFVLYKCLLIRLRKCWSLHLNLFFFNLHREPQNSFTGNIDQLEVIIHTLSLEPQMEWLSNLRPNQFHHINASYLAVADLHLLLIAIW